MSSESRGRVSIATQWYEQRGVMYSKCQSKDGIRYRYVQSTKNQRIEYETYGSIQLLDGYRQI